MPLQTILDLNRRERIALLRETLRTTWVIRLGALLAIQLLAVVVLATGGRGALDPASLDQPLLAFEPDKVTSVRIDGDDGKAVALTRSGDGWVLARIGDFPADGPKVDELLESLAGLKRPLPVATSAEALGRHKVADDAFERRVTLAAGDETLATLLIGDSPGFRRVFARPAGEPVVYDLDLPLFDVSDRRDDWITHDALLVPTEQITGVSTNDWSLSNGDDGWRLEGSDTPPDQEAVDELLARLSALGYRDVLGTEAKPEYGQDQPTLDLTLRLADGSTRDYKVSKIADGDELVLKSTGSPWYFELSEYDIEGLAELDRARLLGEDAPGASVSESTDAQAPDDGTAPPEVTAPEAAQAQPGTESAQPVDTTEETPATTGQTDEDPTAGRD